MKRKLLLFSLLCIALIARAQLRAEGHEPTDDHITVGELTPEKGSDDSYSVMVNLVGSRLYTAVTTDIEFPPGLDVEMKDGKPRVIMWKKGGLFPSEYDEDNASYDYSHMVAASFGKVGKHIFRMTCISLKNDNLTATSGQLVKVYLKTSPYVKPGEVKLKVTNCYFNTCVNHVVTQWDCKDQELAVNIPNRERTIPLNISATNKYGTCVLPFAAPLPDGVKAFTAAERSKDKKKLKLAEATQTLEAFTPYILYAANGYTGEVKGTVDEAQYKEIVSNGVLYGTLVDTIQSEGYVLQNKGDGVKFYWMCGEEFLIPSGRCWVLFPLDGVADAPKAFEIEWGTTDAISSPDVSLVDDDADAPVYTLDGRRVSCPQPNHIYVRNGRKFIQH